MTKNPLFSEEMIKLAEKQLAEQKKNLKDFLKCGVQNVPVTDEVLNKLVWIAGSDEHDVMCCHPGYDLNRNIESLQRTLETYRRCHTDLIKKLKDFDAASQDATLFERPQVVELKKHEIGCRKEVFALSSAASALVDIARHVTGKIDIPGFNEIRANIFDSNHHEFIKKLRNNLNHIKFLEPNWAIKNAGQGQTSHFEFNTAKLLRDGDFNKEAREFIKKQKNSIDVRTLFETYYDSVDAFYAWLMPKIENQLPTEVQDYRRCKKAMRANAARCWYKILFTQIVKSETDLYSHLHKYLTPEELKEINRLSHRSKEQIDRIIEILDEDGACDDELRTLIYGAFNEDLGSNGLV